MEEGSAVLRRFLAAGISHYSLLGMGKIEVSYAQLLRVAATRAIAVRVIDNFPALAVGATGPTGDVTQRENTLTLLNFWQEGNGRVMRPNACVRATPIVNLN